MTLLELAIYQRMYGIQIFTDAYPDDGIGPSAESIYADALVAVRDDCINMNMRVQPQAWDYIDKVRLIANHKQRTERKT